MVIFSGERAASTGGKLSGTGGTGTPEQGGSVTLSADGNTLLVGGMLDGGGPGAAWVFTRTGATWSQQGAKLVGTGATGAANQGCSVALSADGNTASLGGFADSSDAGAFWVFTRSGAAWSQLDSKLVGAGGAGNSTQGNSVAVSGDASTILEGGPSDDTGTGAVWPFVISGPAPSIGGFSPGAATVGVAITLTVNGANFLPGAVVNWNTTALATTFVSSTQVTAAVPASLAASAGSASITVVNPDGKTSTASSLPIEAPLTITPASLPAATVGVPYQATLTVSGGTGPYTWSILTALACPQICVAPYGCVVCALPPWLSATFGATTVTLSGTPPSPAQYQFGFQATDSNAVTAAQPYGMIVTPAVSTACTAQPLSFAFTAGGAQPADETCVIGSAPGGVSVAVSSTTSTGGPWLSASAVAGVTPTTVTIAVNTAGLPAGVYSGTVQVIVGGAASSLPVSLTVGPFIACLFALTGGNTASLGSAGTSTGGFQPQAPVSVSLAPSPGGGCSGLYSAASSASWLSATVNGGSFSYTALSNTHPTPRSATLTISNVGGGSQTFTVTEAGDSESLPNRQVRALYQSILGRDPDAAGFAFWTGAGAAGLGQMADSFLTSPEAFNSAFAVMAAHQAANGSAPTYAQYATAVAGIRAGAQSVAQWFVSLTAANASYSPANLYGNLLARSPSASETVACATDLAVCFETIVGYPASKTPVTAANLDPYNRLYIAALYYTILNRDYDLPGYNFWLAVAGAGGSGIWFQGPAGYPTRTQIVGPGTPGQGFIGSPEFQSLYQ